MMDLSVKEIGPSTPAAIVGLNEVPGAGEELIVMATDKEVRELAEKRAEYDRAKQSCLKVLRQHLDDLSALIAEGQAEVTYLSSLRQMFKDLLRPLKVQSREAEK